MCLESEKRSFLTILAQGSISELVSQIFGIEHDYFGSVMSNMAKVCLLLTKLRFLFSYIKLEVHRLLFLFHVINVSGSSGTFRFINVLVIINVYNRDRSRSTSNGVVNCA